MKQYIVLENKKPTRCHLLFYYTSYRLNIFQALLCPSSGARDYDVDYNIGRLVLDLLYVGGYVYSKAMECWERRMWKRRPRTKSLSVLGHFF